ncbi:MAG: phosphoesterase [Nitrospirales bacterium]
MNDRAQSQMSVSPKLEPNIVLYHADCMDGFGAAWALWKRFPTAEYIPVKHGQVPPSGLDGQHVVMADFSYAREVIEQINQVTASFQILDHHITAQAALAGLSYAYFDMKKSGAVLAWEWAHQEPVPWLLQYIQDKDLWEWRLSQSREINAALASYPFDFSVWDSLDQKVLEIEGRAILRLEGTLIAKMVEEAALVSFQGETIPAVYSPVMTSQIGERLCQGFPFCIIWHQQDGRRYFSLRSRSGATDVSAIATKFGGGGHINAAGFSLPLSSSADQLLDPVKNYFAAE